MRLKLLQEVSPFIPVFQLSSSNKKGDTSTISKRQF